MEVLRPDHARSFLALAGPLLERDEARNQLALGISGVLLEHPDAYDVVHYWVVREGDAPVAAALRTPPYNLVLADPISGPAVERLVEAIVLDQPDVPGVVGNVPHVRAAATAIATATGRRQEIALSQGVYGLTAVREVPRAPGAGRVADPEDRDLLLRWLTAFTVEAVPPPHLDLARLQQGLDTRYAPPNGGMWLWEDDGDPVSLAGYSGPTPSGIRIGPVYTPPEHRHRGYGTTLVADLSRSLLHRGHRACYLFTDLSNPTSNAIYERIGYVRVGDALEIRFRE